MGTAVPGRQWLDHRPDLIRSSDPSRVRRPERLIDIGAIIIPSADRAHKLRKRIQEWTALLDEVGADTTIIHALPRHQHVDPTDIENRRLVTLQVEPTGYRRFQAPFRRLPRRSSLLGTNESNLADARECAKLFAEFHLGAEYVIDIDDDMIAPTRAEFDRIRLAFGEPNVERVVTFTPTDPQSLADPTITPDNSVRGHVARACGLPQGVYASGNSMGFKLSARRGLYLPVYCEDWFEMLDAACRGAIVSAGTLKQENYDPFVERRAAREEFGDLLAEGLMGLAHEFRGVDAVLLAASDPDYWEAQILARYAQGEHLVLRSDKLGLRAAHASIVEAQQELGRITPQDCIAFVAAFDAGTRMLWSSQSSADELFSYKVLEPTHSRRRDRRRSFLDSVVTSQRTAASPKSPDVDTSPAFIDFSALVAETEDRRIRALLERSPFLTPAQFVARLFIAEALLADSLRPEERAISDDVALHLLKLLEKTDVQWTSTAAHRIRTMRSFGSHGRLAQDCREAGFDDRQVDAACHAAEHAGEFATALESTVLHTWLVASGWTTGTQTGNQSPGDRFAHIGPSTVLPNLTGQTFASRPMTVQRPIHEEVRWMHAVAQQTRQLWNNANRNLDDAHLALLMIAALCQPTTAKSRALRKQLLRQVARDSSALEAGATVIELFRREPRALRYTPVGFLFDRVNALPTALAVPNRTSMATATTFVHDVDAPTSPVDIALLDRYVRSLTSRAFSMDAGLFDPPRLLHDFLKQVTDLLAVLDPGPLQQMAVAEVARLGAPIAPRPSDHQLWSSMLVKTDMTPQHGTTPIFTNRLAVTYSQGGGSASRNRRPLQQRGSGRDIFWYRNSGEVTIQRLVDDAHQGNLSESRTRALLTLLVDDIHARGAADLLEMMQPFAERRSTRLLTSPDLEGKSPDVARPLDPVQFAIDLHLLATGGTSKGFAAAERVLGASAYNTALARAAWFQTSVDDHLWARTLGLLRIAVALEPPTDRSLPNKDNARLLELIDSGALDDATSFVAEMYEHDPARFRLTLVDVVNRDRSRSVSAYEQVL